MTRMHHYRRTLALRRRHSEAGVAMVATLLVVIILGVLVTIVLSNHSSTPSANAGSASTPTTTQPQSVGAGASEATLASCETNYAAIETALSTYQAIHGNRPPAGTAWATGATSLLQSWPSSSTYVISWNGTTLSVVPHRGLVAHGSYGTASPKSGCYAAW